MGRYEVILHLIFSTFGFQTKRPLARDVSDAEESGRKRERERYVSLIHEEICSTTNINSNRSTDKEKQSKSTVNASICCESIRMRTAKATSTAHYALGDSKITSFWNGCHQIDSFHLTQKSNLADYVIFWLAFQNMGQKGQFICPLARSAPLSMELLELGHSEIYSNFITTTERFYGYAIWQPKLRPFGFNFYCSFWISYELAFSQRVANAIRADDISASRLVTNCDGNFHSVEMKWGDITFGGKNVGYNKIRFHN